MLGIKDIHDKDIYEGDIVYWGHIKGAEERTPRKAVVELSPEIAFRTFNLGKNDHRFGLSNFAYKRTERALEVIGNCHVNADLIEQEKAQAAA